MPRRSTRSKWAAPTGRAPDQVDAIIQNLRVAEDSDSNSSGDDDMSGDDYREEGENGNGAADQGADDPADRDRDDALFKWAP